LADLDTQEELKKVMEELKVEVKKWDELGVLINHVVENNHVRTNMFVGVLLDMLTETGVLDRPVFELRATKKMLDELRKVREQITPEVRKQRLAASGIEIPGLRRMDIPGERKH
jgi:hypothetical protein